MTAFKSIIVLLTIISLSGLQARPLEDQNVDVEEKEDLVDEFDYEYDLDDDGQIINRDGSQYGEDLPINDDNDEGREPEKDQYFEDDKEEEEEEQKEPSENDEVNKQDDDEEQEDAKKLDEKIEDEAFEEILEEAFENEQKGDADETDAEKNVDDDADKKTNDIASIDELIHVMNKEVDQEEPVIAVEAGKDSSVQTNSIDEKFIQRIEDEILEEQNFVHDVVQAAEKRLLKHIVQEMEKEEERILENPYKK